MANTVIVSTSDANMDDSPLWMQAAGGDAAINYTAAGDRGLLDAMIASEGIMATAAFKVTQRGAGANFSVDVAGGIAAVLGDDGSNQGKYVVRSLGTVNVVTPAAPGSGTRVHRIIARVRDKQVIGSGTYDWTLELLEDTGSGTPAQPNSAITLATVSIAAGQASVLNANIVDARPYAQTFNNDGLIAVTTLTGTTASVTFSNIPQTFRNLRLVVNGRSDAALVNQSVVVRANGDTGTNYTSMVFAGATGANPAGAEQHSANSVGFLMVSGASAGAISSSSSIGWILDYTNTSYIKNGMAISFRGDGAGENLEIRGWSWVASTPAAITSLTLFPATGNFVANTMIAIYGEL